jgi:hypothetical protein
VRLPDGRVPSSAQIKANSTLRGPSQTPSNATEAQIASDALEAFEHMDKETVAAIATNVYKAHKAAEEDGRFDFSAANYLRYEIGISLNVTDFVAGVSNADPLWDYDTGYFSGTFFS